MTTLSIETMEAGFIGMPQVILIAVIVLLLFGGKKIPQLMKGLGQGVKEFKDASNSSEKENTNEEENKA
ncbi:MAG: twin-arginine translocase TatA/TatE family subunit [Flavobacteriales bacterium]|nr:twin-arginine translocase TatA/TatE family subunit [Flavobacteriales bacterium]